MSAEEMIISLFGWAATTVLVGSTIPQAIKAVKTQNTEGISVLMLILALTSGLLFVIYGTLVWIFTSPIAGAPIAIGNFLYLIFQTITFSVKLKNIIKNKEQK